MALLDKITKTIVKPIPSNLEKRLQLTKKGTSGLHAAVRKTLLSSRIMGLLPLSGLSNPSTEELRFTLKSPYTIFYIVSLMGQVLMCFMSFYRFLQTGISLSNITNTLFYLSSLVSTLILANIARSWPNVVMQVEAIEKKLPPFTRNVAMYCNVTMFFVIFSALVEHLLSVFYGLTVARSCDSNNIAERFFLYNMPWIFEYTSYSLWKGILIEVFNIQSTFMWSYNDLLIMVIGIYLTEHFIMHNQLLRKSINQEHFSCVEFRTQYLKIVRLVKLINGQIGIYILTSFGSNLYWICMQLFNSLNKSQTGHFIACQTDGKKKLHGIEHTVYFAYSFSFLVVRTLLVLLLAARVHTTSVVPLVMLHEVPSSKFNVEVERFINQINNMKVALSGLDFFYVTRTMILTLLGTIVTYELVLLQFNK